MHALTVTTESGLGADSYVDASFPEQVWGESTLIAIKTNSNSDNHRYGILRFDIGNVAARVLDATFELTYVEPFDPAYQERLNSYVLYGLNDGNRGEWWDEATLNYSNAPALSVGSFSSPAFTSQVAYLGRFEIDTRVVGEGDIVQMASLRLSDFVRADTNGLVTFILQRETANFGVETFASGEHPTALAPAL